MANLGHYELVREIGAGGMSTVYEATDMRIGRRVALKVLTLPPYISQEQGAALVQRLQREARAAGRLNHPTIVTLYDVGEVDGHHFLAMEFLSGPTLRDRLREGPLSPGEAAHVLDGLAAGLDAAHAEGILHRDVKPGNVVLLPDGRVKLADFGVARQLDDATLTQAGSPVGSPAYMAPEQVRGDPASPASDRWALGVVLYEMLAGKPPFAGENVPAVLHQIAYDPAPPLPHASPEIQAILDRALAKEPERRWRSSHELAAAYRAAATPAAGAAALSTGGRLPVDQARRGARHPEPVGTKGGEVAAPARGVVRGENRLRPGWALLTIAAAAALLAAFAGVVQHSKRTAGVPAVRHERTVRMPARQPVAKHSRPPATRVVVTELKPSTAPQARTASPTPSRPAQPLRRGTKAQPTVARRPSPPLPPERTSHHRSGAMRLAREPADSRPMPSRNRPAARHRQRELVPQPAEEERAPRRAALASANPVRSGRAGDRSAAALNARAYRLLKAGRHAEAEPLLREAVRRDPRRAYAQYNLGWSLLSQGRAREALGPLHRTAAQQPERWEPQFRLGQAYARLGDPDRAQAAFARARSLRSRAPGRGRHATRRAGFRRSPEGSRQGSDHAPDQEQDHPRGFETLDSGR